MSNKPSGMKSPKWDKFLREVRHERRTFTSLLQSVSEDRQRAENEFSSSFQRSFSALHSVKSKDPPSIVIPRATRPKSSAEIKPRQQEIEYPYRVKNGPPKPPKPNSAKRIYQPARLLDYRDQPEQKVVPVLIGSPVDLDTV